MASKLSTLCRGTGFQSENDGPKVKLHSTDMTFISHTLDRKTPRRSRRGNRRRAALPQTFSTRRGIILLYPNSILRKNVLGEAGELGDLKSSILNDNSFFSAEFEKWATAVLGTKNAAHSDEEQDVLTELNGKQIDTTQQNTQLPMLLSADSIIFANGRNKKIRPGLSARRYLINLTEGAESKLNCNWKGKGYVSDSTFFEANSVDPSLKRKIKSDLSEVPEPYNLTHFLSSALPLHVVACDYTLPLLDENDYDLFPEDEKTSLKEKDKHDKHELANKALPPVHKASDYAKLPTDAKRALLVDRLIQAAISMAIRKHKEIFEQLLQSNAVHGPNPRKARLDEPEPVGELRSAPFQDFNDALTEIQQNQHDNRQKAKSKLRGRHSLKISLDDQNGGPFSVYLAPRPLGGGSKRPLQFRPFESETPVTDRSSQFDKLPPAAAHAIDGEQNKMDDISDEEEDDEDEQDIVASELLNYDSPARELEKHHDASASTPGMQPSSILSSERGSVLSRLFAKGSSPAMKGILSSIPAEVFEAVEDDLVTKLATHADRIARTVLAKPGNGKILEKDAKLAQEMWAKFLLEPIPQKKPTPTPKMTRESRSFVPSTSPKLYSSSSNNVHSSGMTPKTAMTASDDTSRPKHLASIEFKGPFDSPSGGGRSSSTLETPQSKAARTVVTREFKGAFDLPAQSSPIHQAATHSQPALHKTASQSDSRAATRDGSHAGQVSSPLRHTRQSNEHPSSKGHDGGAVTTGSTTRKPLSPSKAGGVTLEPLSQHHGGGGTADHDVQPVHHADPSHTSGSTTRHGAGVLPPIHHQRPVLLAVSSSSDPSGEVATAVEDVDDDEDEGAGRSGKPTKPAKTVGKKQPLSQQDSTYSVASTQDGGESAAESGDEDGGQQKQKTKAAHRQGKQAPQQKTRLKKQDSSASTIDDLDELDELAPDVTNNRRERGGQQRGKAKLVRTGSRKVLDDDGGDGEEQDDAGAGGRSRRATNQPTKGAGKKAAVRRTDSKPLSQRDEDEDDEAVDDDESKPTHAAKRTPLHTTLSKSKSSKGGDNDQDLDDLEIVLEEGEGEDGTEGKKKAVKKTKEKKEKHKKEKPFIVGMPEESTVLPRLEDQDGVKKGKKGKKGGKKKAKEASADGELGAEVPAGEGEEGEEGGSGDSSDGEHLVLEGAVDVQVNFKRGRKEKASQPRKPTKKTSKVEKVDEEGGRLSALPEAAEQVLVGGESPTTAVQHEPSRQSRRRSTMVSGEQGEKSEMEFNFVPRSPTRMSQKSAALGKTSSRGKTPGETEQTGLATAEQQEGAADAEAASDADAEKQPAEAALPTLTREEMIKRRREAVEQKRRERQQQREEELRLAQEETEKKEGIQREIEREAKAIEEAARAEFDKMLEERALEAQEAEEQALEAERLESFMAFVSEAEKQKLGEFKTKFQEELKPSRALRRINSGTTEGMAAFGQWLTDDAIMSQLYTDDEGEGGSGQPKKMSMQAHKLAMEARRRAAEAERRALLGGQLRMTASAILRRKLFARRLEHWGLMNHAFRLTRAFVWSYFSLLQWLHVDDLGERTPTLDY